MGTDDLVDDLQAQIATLREQFSDARALVDRLQEESDRGLAENDRLRKAMLEQEKVIQALQKAIVIMHDAIEQKDRNLRSLELAMSR